VFMVIQEPDMLALRIEETGDGVCTVLIGHQVVVAGLSRSDARALLEAYRRQGRSS
jgi:hypothetical protein